MMLGVVALGQLENGLAGLVREPGDRADHRAPASTRTGPSSQGVAIAGQLAAAARST